jgi:hypothetical protein
VVALSTLTNSNNLVTLKVVLIFLTALAWLGALIMIVIIIIKRQKRIHWRDTTIKTFLDKDIKGHMTFDNEQITFITDTYKTELKWGYFKYYAEDKNSVFFLPEENLYGAIYFSTSEIGQDNLNDLKTIAKSKLILLDEKNDK